MIPVTITIEASGGDIVLTPHNAQSLAYVQSVSFDGDSVQADEFSAVLRDTDDDSAAFVAQFATVSQTSAVWLAYAGGRTEKYYFKPPLKRIGRDLYQLDAQSPLARLSADFIGDVYDAAPLPDVIAAVIGAAGSPPTPTAPFSVNPLLSSIRVYGWAPYQSRRETLHALMLANGFLIRRDANQDLYFTVPDSPDEAYAMPENALFTGGSVAYSLGGTYSKALITARDYRPNPDAQTLTLYDNAGGGIPAERLTVKFDKPIVASTLATSDGLEIIRGGVNFAVISGVGTLTGKPYDEYVSVISVDGDPGADPERVLSVTDAPLITSLNADSVGERLLAYCNSPAVVNADMVRDTQKTGDCVSFIDPFGDVRTGYITSLSGSITSFDRANAEFVCGYTPIWGPAYDSVIVLTANDTSPWTVPAELDGKTVRVALIGGGTGGASGQHGSDASGVGCGRGLPGAGGNVLNVKITVSAGESYAFTIGAGGAGGTASNQTTGERPDNMTVYVARTGERWHLNPHCSGGTYTPTTLKAAVARHLTPCENCVRDDVSYYISNPGQPGSASAFGSFSSAAGQPADVGFYDIIHHILYATPGPDYGIDGGQATAATENGDQSAPAYRDIQRFSVSAVSPPWDASQSWTSGAVGSGHANRDASEWAYGGIGGGAAVGADGADGDDADDLSAYDIGGDGGDGASASALWPADTRSPGTGGSGGHGGGEGGKGGSGNASAGAGIHGADGAGGSGSAGQAGAAGCILIYYRA